MPDHRITTEWMGERIETLEDLLPEAPRAIVIGINPSRVSVDAGHYYQGRLGQLLFRRLAGVGLFDGAPRGQEDDALLERGVGFTDLVKRPSARATDLTSEELAHGLESLADKLAAVEAPLLIFTFKQTAKLLYGPFPGAGFLPDDGGPTRYVMPGPYAARNVADGLLGQLRYHLDVSR